MGRPKKQTVDYFPHLTGGSRRTIFILEHNWGNDGYAFWFKLLEMLSNSDGHYYDLSICGNLEYLVSYTKCDAETANSILEMLAGLGNIDRTLWEERKVIWCQSLVDNLKTVYDKRTTPIPTRPFSEENIPEKQEEKAEKELSEEKSNEKPKKAPKKKKSDPPKIKYAEFVSLTEAEYDKLVTQYGKEDTARMIEILDNYKGQNGKKYASDYRAILNWVVGRLKEEKERNGGGYGRDTHIGNNQFNPGGFKPSGGFKKQ